MKKYLFLDFDGVLNSLEWAMAHHETEPDILLKRFCPERIERVNRLIDLLHCDVVISSSWRMGREVPVLRALLEASGFRHGDRIIDRTPRPRMSYHARGFEIQSWMDENGVTADQIVILDDESDMQHLKPRLIQTTWQKGMEDHHIQRAIQLWL